MSKIPHTKSLVFVAALLLCISFLGVFAQQPATDLLNLSNTHPEFTAAYLTQNKLRLEDTWNLLNGSPTLMFATTTIGIIDTPIHALHPEFSGEVIGGTFIGKVNFSGSPPNALLAANETEFHGSAVAAIIGANNILGSGGMLATSSPHMNGVMSGVARLPYVLNVRGRPEGSRTAFDTAGDIESLVIGGVKIINISQGSRLRFPYDPQKGKIVANPTVLFVVSAGNDGGAVDGILFRDITPAIYGDMPNVITVGAVKNNDERVSFSSFGSVVSVAAPGDNVYVPTVPFISPLDFGDYGTLSLTSASAPFATAVAGIIKAIKPTLTAAQIKTILTKTANTDPVITDPDKPIGRRLNALKAVCDPLVLGVVQGCPNFVPPSQFVIHATDNISFFNDNMSAGEIKANNRVLFGRDNVHRGNVTTNILHSSSINNHIIGDVGYNFFTLGLDATPPTITGAVTTPTPPPNVGLPFIPFFPAGTTTTTITSDTTLLPGNHGNMGVTNGATLTLLDGAYNFDTLLFFNPHTSLRFSAGTIVNVNSSFFASVNVHILPTDMESSARLPITTGAQVVFDAGNTVSADSLTRNTVVLSNDNVVAGNIRSDLIFALSNNRINVSPPQSLLSLSTTPIYPTSTTSLRDTLNWMEQNIMTTLLENSVASTTLTAIAQAFEESRGVLRNTP